MCALNFNIQYLGYFKSINSPSEVPNLRVRYFSVNIHIPFFEKFLQGLKFAVCIISIYSNKCVNCVFKVQIKINNDLF